jgi:hypothetical protein
MAATLQEMLLTPDVQPQAVAAYFPVTIWLMSWPAGSCGSGQPRLRKKNDR